MTLQQWDTVIGINLTGQFLCAREAVREFKRREISCAAGKIICISSVHELMPWAGHVNYAAPLPRVCDRRMSRVASRCPSSQWPAPEHNVAAEKSMLPPTEERR
jgi:hypothetical protein